MISFLKETFSSLPNGTELLLKPIVNALNILLCDIPEYIQKIFLESLKYICDKKIIFPINKIITAAIKIVNKKLPSKQSSMKIKESEKSFRKERTKEITDILLTRLLTDDIDDDASFNDLLDLASDSHLIRDMEKGLLINLKHLTEVYMQNCLKKLYVTTKSLTYELEINGSNNIPIHHEKLSNIQHNEEKNMKTEKTNESDQTEFTFLWLIPHYLRKIFDKNTYQ